MCGSLRTEGDFSPDPFGSHFRPESLSEENIDDPQKWLFGIVTTGSTLALATANLMARFRRGVRDASSFRSRSIGVAQPASPAKRPRWRPKTNLPARPEIATNPGEHPLEPARRMAHAALNQILANIKDYSAVMVKRERVGGKLTNQEFMYIKVRHEPFSVYMVPGSATAARKPCT